MLFALRIDAFFRPQAHAEQVRSGRSNFLAHFGQAAWQPGEELGDLFTAQILWTVDLNHFHLV